MVQVNVGQKLVKCNKISSFHWCPKLSSGHCSNEYKCNMTTTPPCVILITNPPPTNYILTLVKLGGPLRKSLHRKKKWREISIFGPAIVAKNSQNTSLERGALSHSKANFGRKTLSPIMSPLLRIQKPNTWSFIKPLRPNLWDTQMEVVTNRFFN